MLSFTTSPCTCANPAHKLQQWVWMNRWSKSTAGLELILHWKNKLSTCWNAKSLLNTAVNFLMHGLRMFHYRNWENRCRLYCFKRGHSVFNFQLCVLKKGIKLFPSFTLQCSFWMTFNVQPTVAPPLISTCCFSSSEDNRDSGRLHVFISSKMGKAPVTSVMMGWGSLGACSS